MKVYIVTEGEYSGYYIHSVHSTEVAAEYFAHRLRHGDVAEWEVDEINPADYPADMRPFQVDFDEHGAIDGVHQDDDDALLAMRGDVTQARWGFMVYVLARDQEHARKAAQDRRAQWLAEQAGIA